MNDVRQCGLISLTSDFGHLDPYVGLMKAAIKRHHLAAEIIDLCHEVPAFDVTVGAFVMASAIGRFPSGTVHLGVVDPGVGGARRLIAVQAKDCLWLAPDNGLLSEILNSDGHCSVRVLDLDKLGLRAESTTFHGRDLLGPVAGMLSSGRCGFASLGPLAEGPVTISGMMDPHVIWVDGYGNLVINHPMSLCARGSESAVLLGSRRIPLRESYGQAEVGELVAVINSYGLLEIAVREGRAADTLNLTRGSKIDLTVLSMSGEKHR